jgi:putative SOS response-associated peptidase YedK
MCNLYSITTTQQAMRNLFKVEPHFDFTGNLPLLTGVFPDYEAPVVRIRLDGEREMLKMRWGIPGPVKFGERPVTNVRNVASSHWRAWLKPEYRCLVPATAFSEYTDTTPKVIHWFAREGEARHPFAFAGIWRPWTGRRGTVKNPIDGEHLLFSFLTAEANAVVRPIHSKAMPVILTEEDWDFWLTAPTEDALKLQKPAPDALVSVVDNRERQDPPERVDSKQLELEELPF